MPNYFQLLDRVEGKATPFNSIDAQLCDHFGVPVHEKNWYFNWYPVIMEWGVACGRSFEKQLSDVEEQLATADTQELKDKLQHWKEILMWLDKYYTADAWYRPN